MVGFAAGKDFDQVVVGVADMDFDQAVVEVVGRDFDQAVVEVAGRDFDRVAIVGTDLEVERSFQGKHIDSAGLRCMGSEVDSQGLARIGELGC